MAEVRTNLCAFKNDTSAIEELSTRITQRQYHWKENQPLTRVFGSRPHLELLGHRGLGLFERPLQLEEREIT
jgi:hypothetical protein